MVPGGSGLDPLKLPANSRLKVFAESKTVLLAPWLFLGALGLFVVQLLFGLLAAMV